MEPILLWALQEACCKCPADASCSAHRNYINTRHPAASGPFAVCGLLSFVFLLLAPLKSAAQIAIE